MITSLLKPWLLMAISTFYLLLTILTLLVKRDFRTLLSRPAFNDAWFGNFWTFMGPLSKTEAQTWVRPLLEGRIQNGQIFDSGTPIEGVVLEVGAGSGMWTSTFAEASRKSAQMGKGVRRIFGVEPNGISAKALRQRVKEEGLEGTYEVLAMGIEDLQRETSIEMGSLDAVVTVQCLCSIPEPEKNVSLLYKYLKPGGRWYVYEHVRAEGAGFVSGFQSFTNYFWEFLMGSCHLCRPTRETILSVGVWDEVDLVNRGDESELEVIPHLVGVLRKAL